jgi:LuxR family transcriptional regulator
LGAAPLSIKNIVHFLVMIEEVPTAALLTAEVERLLASYNFKYYCIFHAPRPVENPAELIIAANWPPEWVARYVERKYILTDPTIRYLIRANRSFSWRDAVEAYQKNPHFQRMARMMSAGKTAGLGTGYIFPIFGRGGLIGATTVGGPKQIDLSPTEMALLETAFRSAFLRYRQLAGDPMPAMVPDGIELTLTHREMQALSHLSDGKTSPEIANELDVSANTVDWYVTSLQGKLNAKNRIHTVALAFRLGLIS